MYIFGIREQFANRKITITTYRASSNVYLHIGIFNLQDLRAPDRTKKKRTQQLILHPSTAFPG
jgi:hypothetical protein